MPDFLPEPEFRHDYTPKTGVLLINLGTPEAPTAKALRPYLKEFLSDRRVVEIPRLLWWPILNGVILTLRPKKSAAKYASVWTAEGSPLLVHTQRQTKLLKGWLGEHGLQDVVVDFAMRYGNPSVADTLTRMRKQGVERLVVVPLYPQYAGSSSGTAIDAVFRVLQKMRNMPEVRTVRHFHDDAGYIGALAGRIRAHWAVHGRAQKLVLSFHGVPRRTLEMGDPYHCECLKTGRLLAEALELSRDDYVVTFQSRFGRAEWLQPYTEPTLEKLAKEGVHSVDIACPGFVADCLETLEEIAMEGKQAFMAAGGRDYRYIDCLNESADWIAALGRITVASLGDWTQNTKVKPVYRLEIAKSIGATQ